MTGGPSAGPIFGVADVQDAGVDLLQGGERGVRPGLMAGIVVWLVTLDAPVENRMSPNGVAASARAAAAEHVPAVVVDGCDMMNSLQVTRRNEGRGRGQTRVDRDECAVPGVCQGSRAPRAQRSERNVARSSSLNSCGCSQAAKWPPLGSRL